MRDGREMTFSVTVSERKEQPEVAARGGRDDFGMAVQDITPEISRYLGIPRKSGVIVAKVEPGRCGR